jgi:hypothetical protein
LFALAMHMQLSQIHALLGLGVTILLATMVVALQLPPKNEQ